MGAAELANYLVTNGKALQQAEMDAHQEIKEIDGAKFVWNRNNYRYEPIKAPIPDDEPVPAGFMFFTLDGIIDYIRENTEGLIPDEGDRLILQVEDESRVTLWSKPSKHKKQRSVIARCDAHAPKIPFGCCMDLEEFNTMLLSKFIDTPARANLFKVAKNMTSEQSLNTSDNGVSQVITVKQGVSLAANIQFDNPVPLRPMRTFAEVEQPESNFTFRVDENSHPALFEADGGAWRNEAVANIKEYLKTNLYGHNVVVLA